MWLTAKERMEHIYEEDCIASVPSDEGIAALLADRAAVLERLANSLGHSVGCPALLSGECDCKLRATLAEILERTNE